MEAVLPRSCDTSGGKPVGNFPGTDVGSVIAPEKPAVESDVEWLLLLLTFEDKLLADVAVARGDRSEGVFFVETCRGGIGCRRGYGRSIVTQAACSGHGFSSTRRVDSRLCQTGGERDLPEKEDTCSAGHQRKRETWNHQSGRLGGKAAD